MSVSPEEMNKKKTFRRYKDGKTQWRSWQDKIFEADASHKVNVRHGFS